ncbi:MAG: hypothetical protein ACR2PZ_00595 [Pseudomonadales bacterium]
MTRLIIIFSFLLPGCSGDDPRSLQTIYNRHVDVSQIEASDLDYVRQLINNRIDSPYIQDKRLAWSGRLARDGKDLEFHSMARDILGYTPQVADFLYLFHMAQLYANTVDDDDIARFAFDAGKDIFEFVQKGGLSDTNIENRQWKKLENELRAYGGVNAVLSSLEHLVLSYPEKLTEQFRELFVAGGYGTGHGGEGYCGNHRNAMWPYTTLRTDQAISPSNRAAYRDSEIFANQMFDWFNQIDPLLLIEHAYDAYVDETSRYCPQKRLAEESRAFKYLSAHKSIVLETIKSEFAKPPHELNEIEDKRLAAGFQLLKEWDQKAAHSLACAEYIFKAKPYVVDLYLTVISDASECITDEVNAWVSGEEQGEAGTARKILWAYNPSIEEIDAWSRQQFDKGDSGERIDQVLHKQLMQMGTVDAQHYKDLLCTEDKRVRELATQRVLYSSLSTSDDLIRDAFLKCGTEEEALYYLNRHVAHGSKPGWQYSMAKNWFKSRGITLVDTVSHVGGYPLSNRF